VRHAELLAPVATLGTEYRDRCCGGICGMFRLGDEPSFAVDHPGNGMGSSSFQISLGLGLLDLMRHGSEVISANRRLRDWQDVQREVRREL
jgi:hypothetical protein